MFQVLKLPPFVFYFPQTTILIDEVKMESIRRAVESYNKYTCVRYVPATAYDGDYANFMIDQRT